MFIHVYYTIIMLFISTLSRLKKLIFIIITRYRIEKIYHYRY